jgi:hypothetical protein
MEDLMSSQPEIDIAAAHRHFSAACFNHAWDLIDKADRTPEEDEEMVELALAAHWHWSQRTDCTAVNHSIGYWQISRVYALLKQGDNALRYSQLCLDVSQAGAVPPFLLGYAHESRARAEWASGNLVEAKKHLQEARRLAAMVTDQEDQKQLLADLDTIRV